MISISTRKRKNSFQISLSGLPVVNSCDAGESSHENPSRMIKFLPEFIIGWKHPMIGGSFNF